MLDNETGVDILVFVSSVLLCIPPAVMIFVQFKLLGKADKHGADSERKITRLYTFFDSVYFCYALLVVAVAIVVAWSLSDSSYARKYILPFAVSITLSIVSRRGKKSSEAITILEKVICNFAEYSRKTGISGVPLAKENVTKDWPPFALFLRSFHLEQRTSQPLLLANLSEVPHEKEFIRLIEGELNLFVLGLGRQEVLEGAARLQLPSELDWKTVIFLLAAAAEVVFIWPGASDGTIWEMDVCLSHFRRKTIFYTPKLSATEEDRKLSNKFSFMDDVLRKAGLETPTSFEENTFWIYSDDNTFRSFRNVDESYAYVNEKASDQRAAN
jgi:hypothetical protein